MPTVNKVIHARKDYPEWGIKKGDTYYKWSFRHGGEQKSLTPPSRSQLTQSSFLQQVYNIEDRLSWIDGTDIDDIRSEVEDIISEIEMLIDETQGNLENIPESLQEAPVAELLRGRIESLQEMIDEIQSVDLDIEDQFENCNDGQDEDEDDDELQEAIEDIIYDLNSISYSGD